VLAGVVACARTPRCPNAVTADAATPAPPTRNARLLRMENGMSANDTSGRERPIIE
jgi:hypothetical protein